MLDTRKYDVYGALRAGGVGTRHRFVGQLGHTSDGETGLLYMRARYYDPVVGRFVSEDPKGDGWNWYVYACNNPANGVDATGAAFSMATLGELLAGFWFLSRVAIRCPFFRPVLAGFVIGILLDSALFLGRSPSTGDYWADTSLGVALAVLLGPMGGGGTPADVPVTSIGGIGGQVEMFSEGYVAAVVLTMVILDAECER